MISEKLSKDQNGQRKWVEADRTYKHERFKKRQEEYKKIIERDCYGYSKKGKV